VIGVSTTWVQSDGDVDLHLERAGERAAIEMMRSDSDEDLLNYIRRYELGFLKRPLEGVAVMRQQHLT